MERTLRKFNTGAVRDTAIGKGRCDLLPFSTLADTVEDPDTLFFKRISEMKKYRDLSFLETLITDYILVHFKTPADAILLVSKRFEEGAEKYNDRNWEKGLTVDCFIDSATRHFLQHEAGYTDEQHEVACLWNLICLHWTVKQYGWDYEEELQAFFEEESFKRDVEAERLLAEAEDLW